MCWPQFAHGDFFFISFFFGLLWNFSSSSAAAGGQRRREKAPRHSLIKERSRKVVNCRLFFRRNSSRLDRALSFPDRGEEEMGEENNFSFLWETIKRPQVEWSSGRMRTPDHPRLRQIKLSIWEERGRRRRRRRGNRLMTTPLSPFFFCGGRRRPFVSRTAVGVWFSTNFRIGIRFQARKTEMHF